MHHQHNDLLIRDELSRFSARLVQSLHAFFHPIYDYCKQLNFNNYLLAPLACVLY